MGLGAAYGDGSADSVAAGYAGAFVTHDAAVLNVSPGVVLPWNTEQHDEGGFHDNVTNNSRMTIPSDVSRIRLSCQINLTDIASSAELLIEFLKNGSSMVPPNENTGKDFSTSTFTNRSYHLTSHAIEVVEGDYFEVKLTHSTTTSDDTKADECWFQLVVLE